MISDFTESCTIWILIVVGSRTFHFLFQQYANKGQTTQMPWRAWHHGACLLRVLSVKHVQSEVSVKSGWSAVWSPQTSRHEIGVVVNASTRMFVNLPNVGRDDVTLRLRSRMSRDEMCVNPATIRQRRDFLKFWLLLGYYWFDMALKLTVFFSAYFPNLYKENTILETVLINKTLQYWLCWEYKHEHLWCLYIEVITWESI